MLTISSMHTNKTQVKYDSLRSFVISIKYVLLPMINMEWKSGILIVCIKCYEGIAHKKKADNLRRFWAL